MFEWEHILHFKGLVKLEDVSEAIWDEHLDVKTLAEAQQFYKLRVETRYYHWGRGMDENGDFQQHLLYKSRKGRGSFLVTTIEYSQKQHAKDCQHSCVKVWNTEEKKSIELIEIPQDIGVRIINGGAWRECRLPNKGDAYFLDHNVCKICKEYQRR